MNYKKASEIFPEALLREVQKYAGGELLYIPAPDTQRRGWGECSGARAELAKRNAVIRAARRSGLSFDALSDRFCLSIESIRKIIYTKNR